MTFSMKWKKLTLEFISYILTEQKGSETLYPSIENHELEQHPILRIKEINCFKNSIQNIKNVKHFFNLKTEKSENNSKI